MHETLGRLDYTHLPLDVLYQISPEDCVKLEQYRSFALIRHPEARFVSALSQHLKMYGAREIAQLTAPELDDKIQSVVRNIAEPGAVFQPEFIHFAPQIAFVELAEKRLVTELFTTERVADLIAEIGALTGEDLGQIGHDNPTLVFRKPILRDLALRGKQISQKWLGTGATTALRGWARQIFMKPLGQDERNFGLNQDIRDFVHSFYAEDFALYVELTGAEAVKAAQT